MRKNWLAEAALRAWRFRQRPLVPDAEFQSAAEPYPGHWRRFPEPWPPAGPKRRAAAQTALDELPDVWRRVLLGHDVDGWDDEQIAADLGITVAQERDILTEARAAVRDRADGNGAP